MMPLSLHTLFPLLPIIILSSTAVLLMLLIAFVRSHLAVFLLSLGAVIAACVAACYSVVQVAVPTTALLAVTPMTQHYWLLILFSTFICVALSYSYLAATKSFREEWYLLLLIAATGALVLAASHHFAAVFIGLELLSVPLYGLAAFALQDKKSLEAGLKYLVLSAVASAFLLFGMALIYAESGSLAFLPSALSPVMILAGGLVIVALGFKLSWVPFHVWTPDVYQGAPMPATAFFATASKVAVMVVLMKLMAVLPLLQNAQTTFLIALIAGASIIAGNLLAMNQSSLKRLLAYSSVAHFGYLLIALLAVNPSAIWIYLVTYVIASLGAFAVLSAVTQMGDDAAADDLSQLRGLAQRSPFLAVALSISLLSMAGIPLTAGFIGKFSLFVAGMTTGQWILLAIAILGSTIGIYYYLRVVSLLFKTNNEQQQSTLSVSLWNRFIVAGLAALTLMIGVWPGVLV